MGARMARQIIIEENNDDDDDDVEEDEMRRLVVIEPTLWIGLSLKGVWGEGRMGTPKRAPLSVGTFFLRCFFYFF